MWLYRVGRKSCQLLATTSARVQNLKIETITFHHIYVSRLHFSAGRFWKYFIILGVAEEALKLKNDPVHYFFLFHWETWHVWMIIYRFRPSYMIKHTVNFGVAALRIFTWVDNEIRSSPNDRNLISYEKLAMLKWIPLSNGYISPAPGSMGSLPNLYTLLIKCHLSRIPRSNSLWKNHLK